MRICPICNKRSIPEHKGVGRPRTHCIECTQEYKKRINLREWRKRYNSDPEFRKKHQENSKISNRKYHLTHKEEDNARNRRIRNCNIYEYRNKERKRKRREYEEKRKLRSKSKSNGFKNYLMNPKSERKMKDILDKIFPNEIKRDNKTFYIISGKLREIWRRKKGSCELDRFYPKLKLAFEYNGLQHYKKIKFFERNGQGLEYTQRKDKEKREMCEVVGIKLIIIKEEDLKESIIKQMINEANSKNQRLEISLT